MNGINVLVLQEEGKEFFLKHFHTPEEAASATRLSATTIRQCCEGTHTVKNLVFRHGARPSPPLNEVDASVLVILKDQAPISKKHLAHRCVFTPYKAVEVLSLDGTLLRRFESDYYASWHIQQNNDDRDISVGGVGHAAVAPDSRMKSFCWQLYEAMEPTEDTGPVPLAVIVAMSVAKNSFWGDPRRYRVAIYTVR
jgi:hypothetical protein